MCSFSSGEQNEGASHLWLLLTAAYGLANANVKWHFQSDNLMLEIGLIQSAHILQLFYQK